MIDKFRPQRHRNAVLTSSKARGNSRIVLFALTTLMDFDSPVSTVTKTQITNITGKIDRRRIMEALRDLQRSGEIFPMTDLKGGRGHAETYRLNILGADEIDKEGRCAPPFQEEAETLKGGAHDTKGGRSRQERGAHNAPPFNNHKNQGDKDGPRRAGGDKASGGKNGGPNSRLIELMASGMDYTTARRARETEEQQGAAAPPRRIEERKKSDE